MLLNRMKIFEIVQVRSIFYLVEFYFFGKFDSAEFEILRIFTFLCFLLAYGEYENQLFIFILKILICHWHVFK